MNFNNWEVAEFFLHDHLAICAHSKPICLMSKHKYYITADDVTSNVSYQSNKTLIIFLGITKSTESGGVE